MSGHSKWSTIKRKKAATDAKRGKLFTRLLKEVQMAAKLGGGSVDGNPRLKSAVLTAKSNSVPGDNIERAIQRGTGELEGVDYEEITYEGYAPGGVALLIKSLTDNKNRTVAEVRHALTKYGGSLAGANAVAYMFQDKGVVTISKDNITEEELYDVVLEAGAEDITDAGDSWQVIAELAAYHSVTAALSGLDKEFEDEIQSIPDTTVTVSGDDVEKLMKLLDVLDDLDDVQSVSANFDIDDAELAELNKG